MLNNKSMYRIEIWKLGINIYTKESKDLYELIDIYKNDWKTRPTTSGCYVTLFKDNEQLSQTELQILEVI